jgi:hypothetical protein
MKYTQYSKIPFKIHFIVIRVYYTTTLLLFEAFNPRLLSLITLLDYLLNPPPSTLGSDRYALFDYASRRGAAPGVRHSHIE